MTRLSDNLYTRPATLADLEEIVALLNGHSLAFGGMQTPWLTKHHPTVMSR